jgi:hypothetical protein
MSLAEARKCSASQRALGMPGGQEYIGEQTKKEARQPLMHLVLALGIQSQSLQHISQPLLLLA